MKYEIKKTNYEIEFLRAISVLFVLLFHFGFKGFDAGFIGVDIFFVISGYLITSIIYKDKNLSLIKFYERRLKRLLPIILFTSLLTLSIGIFILSPIHFERLIGSSLTSILGISNFFFFNEAGYFDHEKLFKPLLHTWSLSVEIQFYLLWPFIIILIKKKFKNIAIFFISTILILSLIASTIYSPRSTSFFYFTGFRIYEFAFGSLLFFVTFNNNQKKNTSLFYAGIFVIFFSLFYFNSTFNFPGFYAVLPCIGAFLIIYSNFSSNNKNSIIASSIIRFLGSRSYTIYMLHWPILIFYSYEMMNKVNIYEKILLLIFILIISNIIYIYFEAPFRSKNKNKENNIKLLLLFIFSFSLILVTKVYFDHKEKNFSKNKFYNNEIIQKSINGMKLRNDLEAKIRTKQNDDQIYQTNDNRKKILVLGNSHAFDFFFALRNIESYQSKYNFFYYDFDYLYCFKEKSINDKIVNYINYQIFNRKNSCQIVFNETNFKFLNDLDYLILASRWSEKTDFEALINYFKTFKQNLLLVGNSQKFYDVPTLYFKKGSEVNSFAINYNNNIEFINEKILLAIKDSDISFFDKSKLNCNTKCVILDQNNLVYSDKDHWSFEGIKYFSNKLEKNNLEKYFQKN